ncbi:MAG: phenylalanine--tRNA ligase subunit alpha [Candidatus Taylorbacteria bacterium RIFCSPHIGHO2_02_FULL_45_28]|uniref:phenylalanine--tRNA ligase n=1 Tax=Candidatus Taylorbacteria bacterium RIFCSPHIGHO2_12_FULL_45_16 TaxID=1802315 RepID=A0A1G2MYV8_9BACT|nr:MAG: phenylalanine--tRNA ligase subunit alpha [Candidatus Taylorbacteria bacterium RIFCSPHIGHO2_01_FULL_44_110]OHA25457.1 MAG: phenylalanine--tRNA ligase subunit alpha [Candidatus Taylorbacteria bacterium RIFCSPHIGHO2_02_FULL_45_28]OHA29125.1 MAG: phenylalanine--tRNA ligase subunit alpha [Candidatus Taylorbacteria bacterium RIFCSPHIGHO2_12_FULL_45_16]OHA33347.1 MAG: phenylalanine--tRNA ligase subunit alpha [Candidatus Taylorbacteria bacterium RIFCSPLOWO2_01_FULL_45_59]OHA38741.1 MAG: phenyla
MNPEAKSAPKTPAKGHLHPMTQIIREIQTVFGELGFEVADGPELETEHFNFDALNVPADHPARDMQDTFWIKPLKGSQERPVLRTHTTSVTARALAECKDQFPIRKIFLGKVFRNEATDITHEAQFFQLDGVYVDKNVSLADLKSTLLYFYKKILGDDVEVRFRPSYFSFTEPSAEVDVKFKGKWLEMMGAGMLHQNVFKAAGVDPDLWCGFAFGGGIDRLLMVKYGIDDIRSLYSGDLRFVNQF